MPIIYCTSFNGLDVPHVLPGLTYPGGTQYIANVLTRYFGMGDATASSTKRNGGDTVPIIYSLFDYTSGSFSSAYGYVTVGKSSFDPKSNALINGHFKSSVGGAITNANRGALLDLRNFMSNRQAGFKFILGFRLGTVYTPGCAFNQAIIIGSVNASLSNTSLTTLTVPAESNVENYIELEVSVSTPGRALVMVYVNGVQVYYTDTTYCYGFWVGRQMSTASNNSLYPVNTPNPHIEIRDLYLMEVKGENDIRIGSTASVVKLDLASDSSAEFRRPDGYASNASVAKGDMTSIEDDPLKNGAMAPKNPGQVLVGDEVGQQDLYNLDISSATSTLGSVDAVVIRSVAMTPGVASRSFSAIARSGANQVSSSKGPTVLGSGNEYQVDNLVLNADPADDARWNLTKLAGLKVGTKLVS